MWLAAGDRTTAAFIDLLRGPVASIVTPGGLDFPNPIGLTEADIAAALDPAAPPPEPPGPG